MGRGKAVSVRTPRAEDRGQGPLGRKELGGGAPSNMGHTVTHSEQQQVGGQGEQASHELGS